MLILFSINISLDIGSSVVVTCAVVVSSPSDVASVVGTSEVTTVENSFFVSKVTVAKEC